MKPVFPALAACIPLAVIGVSGLPAPASQPPAAPVTAAKTTERSPSDVAVTPDGHFALTTNRTTNTVSYVDLTSGKVIAEVAVGKEPFSLALSQNGKQAVVTNFAGDSISVLELSPTDATVTATVPVGDEPRGVVLTRDARTAYVALAGQESVAVVDLATRKVTKRLTAGTEPWHLILTSDEKRLAVGNTRSRDVTVFDLPGGKEAYTVRVFGRNLRQMVVSPDNKWAYVPAISERLQGTTKENIDLGWVVGNRLTRIPLEESGPREAITLDARGEAVGDVEGLALSPGASTIALTAGGTHELLIFRDAAKLPFVAYGGPGDHIDRSLLNNPARYRRVPLGGRPVSVKFLPDGKQVIVADYFGDKLQIVDTESGTITRTIALGEKVVPSLARKGEAIFHDAKRSFNQWYSCSTCHTEGHTNGGNFDTFNDGSYGKPKKTLSLRGVARTAPYTWHGWQQDLHAAVRESFTKSMQGEMPSDDDVNAVYAYLQTLDFPQSPYRNPDGTLTVAAQRGAKIFTAKACDNCHGGKDFATPVVLKVGLESPNDAYSGFNPPTLRNVYDRAPYLHDGRADTLEEVIKDYHQPSKLTGKPDCTPAELSDLVLYLKSL